MNTETAAKMIARRVSKGYNEAESIALLAELLNTRGAGTIASALVYDEFATGAEFEPWIPTAELGCIVMANQRTITTSAWSGYESPPTPCAPSCRTLCEGCSPEPLERA